MLKKIVLIGVLCLFAFLGLARLFRAACDFFTNYYKKVERERACHACNGEKYDKHTKAMEEILQQSKICEKIQIVCSGLFLADAVVTFCAAVILIVQVF